MIKGINESETLANAKTQILCECMDLMVENVIENKIGIIISANVSVKKQ